jgi:hypothetical protein
VYFVCVTNNYNYLVYVSFSLRLTWYILRFFLLHIEEILAYCTLFKMKGSTLSWLLLKLELS